MRIVLFIFALCFIGSVAALIAEWLLPHTLLGEFAEMILGIHIIPDAWVGSGNFFTGRNMTWISIGWKIALLFFLLLGGASLWGRKGKEE